MISVYLDGFTIDGQMDLLKVVKTFYNFVERLCLIPTEVKAQCLGCIG